MSALLAGTAHADNICKAESWRPIPYDHKRRMDQFYPTETDHFVMMFSWSPGFCERTQRDDGTWSTGLQFQCASGNRFGWIVHGLWAQAPIGLKGGLHDGHPRYCTDDDLPAVPEALIRKHICTAPGARLLQGQWEKHGACAFNSADAYFEQMTSLYEALIFPDHNPGEDGMVAWMKENNPALASLRTGWKNGEFAVCYNKDFQLINCP